MSALADMIRRQGHTVSGSDRGHDHGDSPEKFNLFTKNGMVLHRQDGTGVVQGVDRLVVSSAVEKTIPDVQAAISHNIPILKRAELLASLFNAKQGVGIAGTSGKTTTTGMTGWMLHALGLKPTIANGGVMPNFVGHPASLMGNAVVDDGDLFVAEMDESDGTIEYFTPYIAVLNNITLDHKPFHVIEPLFRDFLAKARECAIINLDDARAAQMVAVHPKTLTYGINRPDADFSATDLHHLAHGISFKVQGHPCTLSVPGRHNVSNALASLAVANVLGVSLPDAITALEGFKGIKRRLEILGAAGGVTVIDDFGHNPDKIAASLETLAAHPGRALVMFQPHGFGPMKLMRKEIVESFVKNMRPHDILVMPEIFYAGGTVARDISSKDLIDDIVAGGRDARFCQTRFDVGMFLLSEAQPGDRIVIMGARDDTLSDFAHGILQDLQAGNAPKLACNGARP